MKLTIHIDKEHEEEIIIYSKEESEIIEKIRNIVDNSQDIIIGYTDCEILKLNPAEIECFIVENNKIFALTDTTDRYRVRERLYKLEQIVPESFIKINQSCLANTDKIKKFDVSFSGSLTVIFKSGYRDYVSRRNLKNIKERFGI